RPGGLFDEPARSIGGGTGASRLARLGGRACRSPHQPLCEGPLRRALRPGRFCERDRVALPAMAEQDAEFSARARRPLALRERSGAKTSIRAALRAARP